MTSSRGTFVKEDVELQPFISQEAPNAQTANASPMSKALKRCGAALPAYAAVTGRHQFQGRYEAVSVQTDTHLRRTVRYVIRNPVRARLSSRPE